MEKRIVVLLLTVFACHLPADAQNPFPNTLSFDSLSASPQASLSDVEWIQGHWRGRAFGGITEEIWTPPLGGSMMGAFKLVVDGKVKFYELVTIVEQNQTLLLRLKHFHGDLKGWEARDETVDFPLVKVSPNKVFFDDFTFERVSANELNMYVVIEDKEGKQEEVTFNYKRT